MSREHETQDDLDTWRRAFAIRLDSLERGLAETNEKLEMNTEATCRIEANTQDAVSMLKSLEGFTKVVKWVVPFLIGSAGLYTAFGGVWPWR